MPASASMLKPAVPQPSGLETVLPRLLKVPVDDVCRKRRWAAESRIGRLPLFVHLSVCDGTLHEFDPLSVAGYWCWLEGDG